MWNKIFNSPSLTTIINLSVKGLALVLINPFIFKIFSDEEVVIWYLILSAVSIQLIFDFGLLPNTTRILSRKIGELELCKATSSNIENFKNQTFSIYILLSLIILFSSAFIVRFYLSNKTENFISEYFLYIILSLGCIGIFNNYFGTILQASRKVQVLQRNLALTSFISISLCSLSLLIFQNLGLALFLFYSNHLINFFLLPNYLPKEDRIRRFSLNPLKPANELIYSSIRSGIGVIFSLGFFHLINFYVAEKFNATDAAQFMLFMQVIRAISSFSQAPFYAFIPEYNYLYGLNRMNELIIEVNKRLNYSLILYLSLIIFFSASLPYLFRLIGSEKSFSINNTWKAMVIAFFLERISSSFVQVISISKRIIWHWYNAMILVLIILLNQFFLNRDFLTSIPLSIGLSYAIFGVPLAIILTKKEMGFWYSKNILIYFLISAMIIIKIHATS